MPTVAPRRPTAPASTPEVERAAAPPVPFRWTREQYDRAIEAGVFGPADKIELLEGELVYKMSQNEPHAVATGLASDVLREAFGAAAHVRDEKPIALSDLSEPEPDLVVVPGERRDYLASHPEPSAVLLLVEVADSSLLQDRSRKVRIYAEANITEYWIVNLVDRVLEVHRDPAGGAYQTKTTHKPGESVAPVARPDASVAVASLLP